MSFELRAARPEEHAEVLGLISWAFGGTSGAPEEIAAFFTLFEPERVLAADDGGALVGGSGAFAMRLAIPGGELPCAGVTIVAVRPSDRRRGILTGMMRRLLDDARERGEPLAALFASEGAIYGRYGYGIAVAGGMMNAERDHVRFRDPPHAGVRTRGLTHEQALDALPPLYDRLRAETPGMPARSREWWSVHRLQDTERARRGGSELFRMLLELDGEPAGYALYRLNGKWDGGALKSELDVLELVGLTPLAHRELWRHAFSVDLVARVQTYPLRADDPLPLLVLEPPRLHVEQHDALWLRLIDVGAALSARSYAGEGELVLEVSDPFCPWNEGRWHVPSGERSESEPDVRLGVDDLGATYLGGTSFRSLANALRAEELGPGALERADALFRTPRAPWTPEIF